MFWDRKRIIFTDYQEKGKTVNNQYFAELLQYLKNEVKITTLGEEKKYFSQIQCTCPNSSVLPMVKINELMLELFPQSSYITDIALTDYYLLHNS